MISMSCYQKMEVLDYLKCTTKKQVTLYFILYKTSSIELKLLFVVCIKVVRANEFMIENLKKQRLIKRFFRLRFANKSRKIKIYFGNIYTS
jgi:hypothetical protein